MCTYTRFIYNPADRRKYLVNCGHCDACLQEKSDRHLRRISNEQMSNPSLGVFVTLDYQNKYCPYVKKSEVDAWCQDPHSDLNVYRGKEIDHVLHHQDFKYRGSFRPQLTHESTDFKFMRVKMRGNRYRYLDDRVAVINLRDVQLFFKRLERALFRSGYKGYYSYYYATEYGSLANRCHIHALFFIDKEYYQKFKCLLDKSWPYSDLLRSRRQDDGNLREPIEVAKNPAAYLSSYLNSRSIVPSFLTSAKPFRPQTHFSNGFGFSFKEFSFEKIAEKVSRGHLRYAVQSISKGVSTVSQVRVPKYVLSRYFPKFKGYRYLSSDQIKRVVFNPSAISEYSEIISRYVPEDVKEIALQLFSLRRRMSDLGIDLLQWSDIYPKVWSLHSSESIRDSYADVHCVQDIWQHYDNIEDYYSGFVRNDFLDSLPLPDVVVSDPNKFSQRVASTQRLYVKFAGAVKHHNVKSFYYEKESYL